MISSSPSEDSRRSKPVGAVLVILAALMIGSVIPFLLKLRSSTSEVTDPARYAEVLTELGYPKPTTLNIPAIDAFPAQMPSNATTVRFFYRPHFLQGPAMLQLRCGLPGAKIAEAENKFAAHATTTFSAGATSQPSIPGDMLFRNQQNTGFADLPADFQIYVLNSRQTSVDTGWSIGVAISRSRNEIIYWLQD